MNFRAKNPPHRQAENRYADIFNNSVQGYTLGPKNVPQPFDRYNFLDSLKGYISKSRALGWIATQQAADKYGNFIDTTKAELQKNDKVSAQITLDSILANAQGDNGLVLTREAYALIYYNAQYLLNQLPTLLPQYTLTIATVGNGTVTKNLDQTLYDSATAVQLAATSLPNNHFVNWTGDASGTTNPLSITIIGNKNITANFAINAYTLPHATHVSLKVFNVLGEEIAELVNGEIAAGFHETVWQADAVPSGVYFYRLQSSGFNQIKKMLVMK